MDSKLTAIDLVTAIGTFSRTWAHQMAWYTCEVIALKLILTARFILAIHHTLIVTIRTINATVTDPLTIDTGNFVIAHVIRWWANRYRHLLCICAILYEKKYKPIEKMLLIRSVYKIKWSEQLTRSSEPSEPTTWKNKKKRKNQVVNYLHIIFREKIIFRMPMQIKW